MKRSKMLWVVTLFFVWAALKTAGSVYGAQYVSDYALLSTIGFGYLFYVINVPLMLGEAAAAYLLLKRRAGSFVVAGTVIAVEVINGIFMGAIAMRHLDEAKVVYIKSREARGLTVRQENIDSIVSVQGIALAVLACVAFYILLYYFLRKVRPELKVESV